jgi:ribonucleoside-diphosphate reductase alpha chain
VVAALVRRQPAGGTFHIEDVQDQVELSLMRDGAHDVARSYVLYREKRAQERARETQSKAVAAPALTMLENGQRVPLDLPRLEELVRSACAGLTEYVTPDAILSETVKNLYDGVPLDEVYKSAILAARALIERDPAYSYVTARLLLHTVRREVLGEEVMPAQMAERYVESFPRLIKFGIEAGLLDERLAQFDLKRLAAALDAGRDLQFNYLGLQTLYDRYFLHHDGAASSCRRRSSCGWRWAWR